jgi:uncharacterized phiE125 gp8 family phage protein
MNGDFPYFQLQTVTPAISRPGWSLKQIADATVEPVLIGDFKNHLRVNSGLVGGTVALAAAPNGVARANGVVTVKPAAGQPLPGLGQTVALAGVTDATFNGSGTNGSGFIVQSLDTVNGTFAILQTGANATSGAGTYQVMQADDEDQILGYMIAARRRLEQEMGRALVSQTWRLSLDRFPHWRQRAFPVGFMPILLPRPAVIAVTSFKYLDPTDPTGAALITLALNVDFIVDGNSEPARLQPATNKAWPSALRQQNAVVIDYTAGYGIDGATVPNDIKLAIKMLGAHWYENRETVVAEPRVIPQEMTQASLWLIEPYRVDRFWE